jgi:hypothetical protein
MIRKIHMSSCTLFKKSSRHREQSSKSVSENKDAISTHWAKGIEKKRILRKP